jgi:lipopolysaccharide assembly protein A
MRILTWVIRLALFVLLLAFAAKNTDPVTLRFYFDQAWSVPLVSLLLAFFGAGALLGVISAAAMLLRQRRELQRLKREAGRDPSRSGHGGEVVPPRPAEG